MATAKTARTDRLIADAVRSRLGREAGYREQALKIYPWICGRCSREFTRQNLRASPRLLQAKSSKARRHKRRRRWNRKLSKTQRKSGLLQQNDKLTMPPPQQPGHKR